MTLGGGELADRNLGWDQANAILLDGALRLRAPEFTASLIPTVNAQYNDQVQRRWSPVNVAFGPGGLALLYGYLDRCLPEQGWDRIAHTYLTTAVNGMATEHGIPLGALGGLTGLCFVSHYLSRDGDRYQQLTEQLDRLLLSQLQVAVQQIHFISGSMASGDYDAVSGTTGILRYLLLRQHHTAANEMAVVLIDHLIQLSAWHNGQLGFFTPLDRQPTAEHRRRHPDGCTDCGLAHGVPGPLAVLALAHLHGIERRGQIDAIAHLAHWLIDQRIDDEAGVNWPYAALPSASLKPPPCRAAWCYGSPGIASSLWLAGQALADSAIQELAIDAIKAVQRRSFEARGIPGPILCHGVAGLLQTALRMRRDTDDDSITAFTQDLTGQLVALFDRNTPLGYYDLSFSGERVDNPGFLEGASGSLLALASALYPVEPSWDSILLLS